MRTRAASAFFAAALVAAGAAPVVDPLVRDRSGPSLHDMERQARVFPLPAVRLPEGGVEALVSQLRLRGEAPLPPPTLRTAHPLSDEAHAAMRRMLADAPTLAGAAEGLFPRGGAGPRVTFHQAQNGLSAAAASQEVAAAAAARAAEAAAPNGRRRLATSVIRVNETYTDTGSRVVKILWQLSATSSAMCSGSLISPWHVLSAGHCVYDDAAPAGFFDSSTYYVIPAQTDLVAPGGDNGWSRWYTDKVR